ncbi:LAFE_0B10484g1_1 [Lachancea fermentati]|uniref:LAFE_0B10484g1_1 n=1 Tax=Lachancea fermentati TaxID=4955 RepID=A0A1G4M8H1_LACFM|nr:LAFE_0B10484g1_1 [Lachancea fermentati]
MANKRRPKKIKAPYKKYVAGQGFVHTRGFTGSDSLETPDASKDSIIHTPQGDYFYDINTESVVHINSRPSLPRSEDCLDGEAEMVLPWEIFGLVLMQCERVEPQFLCVCRHWYLMCLPLVYHTPQLTSRNFHKFVDTLINNRKKKLGEYVINLNLSTIIQSGKNSFVSKLLRRCSARLEHFTAPQTSFGYAPLISLKSCHQLKYLDLGLVSETVQLRELFSAIKGFSNLTHLSFPRSSVDCDGFREFVWPPNLKYLKLSGGITNEFVRETTFPLTIKTLEFSFCPQINEHAVYTVLAKIGDRLRHLYFHYPMPALHESSLDYVFRYCSNLLSIQLSVDYCSKWAFSENLLTPLPYSRPLRTIILECSGNLGQAFKVHPDDLTIALVEDRLPNLRTIRVTSKLGWDMNSDDVSDLVSCLEDQDGSVYVNY